ncbi:carboxylesterase type B [Yamadazyma tenuis]|uniref:Alpha/beta-hydrolase n=1 Tax=Candida tenuis (strain ATCC 10573 / BCRC 21748 / CBS 615 / JCM 9827 / NBRC 10315 / NRRL Y-1498 / VKM Y-70) TaxID=590646 RepID=G3B3R0_CANTC|nr:alpha/beta-hydrolase [Yamadazyma tenuis ATCC 10573]EGV64213.1 alpha/beta-hydrolase [Yamadazyma tenuis ATCC 10573]WEJ96122.1 carboxylesterase type B [Yamadazyma tenuis]
MKYDYRPTACETQIPGLGSVKGLDYEELGVAQYLGIPYATVPGRFRKSVLKDKWETGVHDGTQLGPMIPQIKRSFYPIPMFDRPWLNIPGQDEYGLNLNISAPKSDQKMPVMVFIHGGANTYGAGNACIYDGLQLAKISVDLKEPTIVISFNYRLGAVGFLASKDLQKYNQSFGEDGVGNYGVSDQTNVLRWVNKYIKYLGGDESRVTLFGQSAGSQATHLALLQNDGLFSRAILQSGLAPLCGIFTVEQYDVVYLKLLKKLGIDTNLPWEKRVAALLAVDQQTLTQTNEDLFEIQFVTMAYTQDGSVLPEIPSWADVGKDASSGVEAIMIGDCVNECIIWNSAYKHMSGAEFVADFKRKCSSIEVAEKFLELYDIKSTDSVDETYAKVESMTSDGMYILPNYIFYQANPSSFVYHFDQKSPYDNEWGGYAHHSLDNVYIWGLLKKSLPQKSWELSEQMSKIWLDFANGKANWEAYKENRKAFLFGDEDRLGRLVSEEEDSSRAHKYGIWREIIDAGLVEEFGRVCEDICLLRTQDHGYI